MWLGVNVPNFGSGGDRQALRAWAELAEALHLHVLTISDHVVVTPDVAVRYPEPFYEPFTALSWLAGMTSRVHLATSVLVVPYRHPLLIARMAVNLHLLSEGRFILGVGVGWAEQEFDALGVPYQSRGPLTDIALAQIHDTWAGAGLAEGSIPLWVGGVTPAAHERVARFNGLWHPLHQPMGLLRAQVASRPTEKFVPRIRLRILTEAEAGGDREPGVGTVAQILEDLSDLASLGATGVVLDPYTGNPDELRDPRGAREALTTIATEWKKATA